MIRSPEAFAKAFSRAAEADLLRPSVIRRRLSAGELDSLVRTDLAEGVRTRRTGGKFPRLREFILTWMNTEEARHAGGMGQWEALASVISSATNLASKYATTKLETETQLKITEYQLQAQALAQQAANLAAQRSLMQMAVAEGTPQAAITATVTGGSEFPIVPVAVGGGILLLLGVYFLSRRR